MARTIVLIETAGNQLFVFDTNKRRENVGASQMISQVGEWVTEACETIGGGGEILTATSGKGIVVYSGDARQIGRKLVAAVTSRALRDAPGLDVAGCVHLGTDESKLTDDVVAVHQRIGAARGRRPSPANRFLRIPIVAECRASGLPATKLLKEGDSAPEARSHVSLAKRAAAEQGYERIAERAMPSAKRNGSKITVQAEFLRRVSDYLENEAERVAIIHADGNGIGKLFFSFNQLIADESDDAATANAFRRLSTAVDLCGRWAFRRAVMDMPLLEIKTKRGGTLEIPPILPLVVGGDDITAVCDASVALPFVVRLLRAFEDFTGMERSAFAGTPDEADGASLARYLGESCDKVLGIPYLTACAGVAVVKTHFPFSIGYHLAEELTASAKQVKRRAPAIPCSAFDFHELLDSTDVSLHRIRRDLTAGGDARLAARPIVVGKGLAAVAGQGVDPSQAQWIRARSVAALISRLEALQATRDHVPVIPRSKVHELRQALFDGRGGAETIFTDLCDRYDRDGQHYVLQLGASSAEISAPSLFWKEIEQNREIHVTGFLDALEARDLVRAEDLR